jgi:hypothetical protein
MDQKDMFTYFLNLRKNHKDEYIYALFTDNNYDITKLDVNRLFRYIDRFTLENAP